MKEKSLIKDKKIVRTNNPPIVDLNNILEFFEVKKIYIIKNTGRE